MKLPGVGIVKNVTNFVTDKGKDALGGLTDGVKDTVRLGERGLEFVGRQEVNFAKGVADWGKSNFQMFRDITADPAGTLQGLADVALNPRRWDDVGQGIVNDLKDQYHRNGIAGVAGNLAPEVLTGILKPKHLLKEAQQHAVRDVAHTAWRELQQDTTRKAIRQLPGALMPGAPDVINASIQLQPDRRFGSPTPTFGSLDFTS